MTTRLALSKLVRTSGVLYVDIYVGRTDGDWAEGVALKCDASGWYVCHPFNVGRIAKPQTMDDDVLTIRVDADEALRCIAEGKWRIRASQEPETDAEMRPRLKRIARAVGYYQPPYDAWDAEVDAAEGAALDRIAAEAYGVLRVCVSQHYLPWGRADKDRDLPLPQPPSRSR